MFCSSEMLEKMAFGGGGQKKKKRKPKKETPKRLKFLLCDKL